TTLLAALRTHPYEHPVVLDLDRVRPDPVLRVPRGLARRDVELPAVPRTRDHRTLRIRLEATGCARFGRAQERAEVTLAHRPALVRTTVVRGEEASVPPCDAELATARVDDPHLAFREVVDRADVDELAVGPLVDHVATSTGSVAPIARRPS